MTEPAGDPGEQVSLRVIPDPTEQTEALGAVERLERAVRVLEDLGLDDAQRRIVDELILPTLSELKQLFVSGATDPTQVQEHRKRSVLRLGAVIGSARAVALVVPVVAEAGSAAENVRRAAEAMHPVADLLLQLLTHSPF